VGRKAATISWLTSFFLFSFCIQIQVPHLAHSFLYPLQGSKSSFEFNVKFEREKGYVRKDKEHHEAKEAQKQTHRGSPFGEI